MKTPIKSVARIIVCIVLVIFILILIFGKQFRAAHLQDLSERHIRRDVGYLRMLVEIYRIDHEEQYPVSFQDVYFTSRNLSVRKLWYGGKYWHTVTDECLTLADKVVNDTGKWVYIYNPESKLHGEVYIDCKHLDSNGKPWHEY